MEISVNIVLLLFLYCLSTTIHKTQGVTTSDGFYIKKIPISKRVEEGASVSFDCLAVPSNHIVYKWKHDDSFITYDHHRYLDPNNRTLRFDHVDRYTDTGKYYCIAQNATTRFSRKSKHATLEVFWMDTELKIELARPSSIEAIKLGSTVEICCRIAAKPNVTRDSISWFFNGKSTLPSSTNIQPNGCLQMSLLTKQHNGFYHCSVIHTAGKLDSLYPFIVNVDSLSQTLPNPKEFSLFEKENSLVIITCPWTGTNIAWSKIQRLGDPFTMLTNGNNAENKVKLSANKLIISDLSEPDDAYYICQLPSQNSEMKEAVFKVSLAKMYDFVSSHFSPALEQNEPLVIKEGENGAIRFYLDFTPSHNFLFDKIPNPIPKITWKFNNNIIPDYDENKVVARNFVYGGKHLILNQVTLADRGVYVIEMTNKADRRARGFRVEIATKPVFIPLPHESLDQTVKEDKSISLNCGVKRMSGQGLSKVYWKKDGIPLFRSKGNVILQNNNLELKISEAKPENSGTYQCFVHTIKFPEMANSLINIKVQVKLQFIGTLNDIFLERNRDGRLPCRTKGHGKIVISWYKFRRRTSGSLSNADMVEVKSDTEDGAILQDGTLFLRNVHKSQAGMYQCRAWAKATNEKITVNLTVEVGERPKITKISDNTTLLVGSDLRLDCKATGDPTPKIGWIIDSPLYTRQLVINYDSKRPLNNKINLLKNGTLIIKNIDLNDDAKYTCIANNFKLTNNERSIYVKVLTLEEYTKYKEGGQFNKGMVKTVVIVVSCAITYLALIVGLTVVCSLRMLRHRRSRTMNDKLGERGQLIPQLGAIPSGQRNGNLSSKKQQAAGHGYLPPQPNSMGVNNYYSQYSAGGGTGPGGNALLLDANHNMPSGQHPILYPPSSGIGLVTTATATSSGTVPQHHMVSAPPPTPLESRSNFSTNSASMYTRSHFSSSTNGAGGSGTVGGPLNITGTLGMNSMERLTYPRHELQTEGFLGKGEFGEVLLARARNILEGESQSLVVVKSLIQTEPIFCHEFHRQLDMLARVECEYVTRLLGICIEMEPYLLILEYCEWGDLKQFLRCLRERSNPNMPNVGHSQKLSFCVQIATGMEAIASQHCVHKDLAARNVLITAQLRTKVTHLGLCREGHHGDYYQDGDRLLPLRWMAPEAVIRGEFSMPSDVWSFGVTMWEIFCTGGNATPLSSVSHEEILDILASSYPPISSNGGGGGGGAGGGSSRDVTSSVSHSRIGALYQPLEHLPPLSIGAVNAAGSAAGDIKNNKLTALLKRCLSIDPNIRPNFSEILHDFKDFITETKV